MDNDALFVDNDVPVKFCFHTSITQGRSAITRDIQVRPYPNNPHNLLTSMKRHGGEVVPSERDANVLLIDEQQDLVMFRRRYYHANERYRLGLYVESRGFVRRCIRRGAYTHERPVARAMPGVARGARPVRVRVPFTEEDRDNLAHYLATTLPTRDGRMGNKAYKELEELGRGDDPAWAWVRRHTWHSWREHYKINPALMDARIEEHMKELEGVGHHMGHDLRRHRQEEDEEDEEEEDEEEETEGEEEERQRQRQRMQRRHRREQGRPIAAARRGRYQVAREYLARHEPDLVPLGKEVEEEEPQHVHRDAHRRSDSQNVQKKRARVSKTPSDEERASGDEAGSAESTPLREEDGDREESPELVGNDLFGDQELEEQHMNYDDNAFPQPEPFLPASPVPEQDVAFPSTQATLVAQSPLAEKERPLASSPMRAVEMSALRVAALEQTVPPSSQQVVVVAERRGVPRSRVAGTSAQQEPSLRRETRTRSGTAAVDGPYRNTRARSRSVEPEFLLQPGRESQKGKGKGKAKEVLAPIEHMVHEEEGREELAEEEIGPVSTTDGLSREESLRDEESVEGILELSDDDADLVPDIDRHQEVDLEEQDDDDDDSEIAPQIASRHQDVDMDQPSDSDDAETHGALIREVAEDEDMNPVAAPEPRMTRSMAARVRMVNTGRTG
ncbi:hypothetical protein JVU11DRAFT_82 [Chiua virens]|nr:hypothetical protein JVU11DRAFT_82 [Chiua virens]